MASTTFVNNTTLTDDDWFNDVDRVVYDILGDPANAAAALAALGGTALGAGLAAPKIPTITASLAASAMTVDMTAQYLDFRSATLTSGTISTINCDPTAVVVPSGATLGTTSGVASRIAVAIVNDGGTAELAVANTLGLNMDESALITTTTIGTGSDSSGTWYSTTGTASKAFRIVGYIDSTQATAGAWATALTQIQGVSINVPTQINSSISVASTSGTSIDFTGLPSGVKRITIGLVGVSIASGVTGPYLVQLGDSGGIETSGYSGSVVSLVTGATAAINSSSTGMKIAETAFHTLTQHGTVTLTKISGTTWAGTSILGSEATASVEVGAMTKTLSGELDRVRITADGIAAFDGGSINIMYEV